MSEPGQKNFRKLEELKALKLFPTRREDRHLSHVSASQITTYRRCPRKWYLQAVEGIREPESAAMKLGTEVHAFIEDVLINGYPPKGKYSLRAEEIAMSGQGYWPDPSEPFWVEDEFVFRHPKIKLPIYGFIDIRTQTEVVDHKTTSQLDGPWSKGVEQWEIDPQGVIYPAVSLSLGGKPRFRIIYYQTKGRRLSRTLVVEQSKGQLEFGLEQIGRDVDGMIEIATKTLSDVPFNRDACSDYGGCFMQPQCAQAGVLPPGVEDGALSEVYLALSSQEGEARPAPEEKQVTMEQAKPFVSKFGKSRADALKKASEGDQGEEGYTPAPPPATPAAQPAQPAQEAAPVEMPANPPSIINPPERILDDADPAAALAAVVNQGADDDEDGDAPPPPALPGAATPVGPAPVPGEVNGLVKRGRGRPPKSASTTVDNAATPGVPQVSEAKAIPEAAPTAAPSEKARLEEMVRTYEASVPSHRAAAAAAQEKMRAAKVRAMADDSDDEAFADVTRFKKEAEAAEKQASVAAESLASAKVALQKILDAEEAERKKAEAARREQAAVPEQAPKARSASTSDARPTLYLGCCPENGEDIVHFDDWMQPYARRAEKARQTPYYRTMPHGAVDAVLAEMLADLRSGAVAAPEHLVIRRFSAQYYQYAQDLRPFFRVISV